MSWPVMKKTVCNDLHKKVWALKEQRLGKAQDYDYELESPSWNWAYKILHNIVGCLIHHNNKKNECICVVVNHLTILFYFHSRFELASLSFV